MNLRRYGGLLIVAVVSAVATYLVAYRLQQSAEAGQSVDLPQERLSRWLGLTPQQSASVREIEAAFAADRAKLQGNLAAQREQLARMLEDPATSNEEILQQVEKVIAAQNALERRVADLLIEMRPHLTAEQQKRLFARFATGVREGCGRQWRHGQHDGLERGRRGGGPPPGRGPGWGQGRGGDSQGRGRHRQGPITAPATQPEGVQP